MSGFFTKQAVLEGLKIVSTMIYNIKIKYGLNNAFIVLSTLRKLNGVVDLGFGEM